MASARRTSSVSLLLAVVASLGAAANLPLPEYVKPCSDKDAEQLSACATQRAKEILPHVMEGDVKYGIPQLDPLSIKKLVVDDGSGPLGMHFVATDIQVHGLRGMTVDRVTHSLNPPEDIYEATIPDLLINSKYNMSGMMLIPIIGFGDAVLSLTNVKLNYRFKWHLVELEDGEIYYLPQPGAFFNVDVDDMKLNLDNLFNGDKVLGEATNNFLNEKWQDVFAAMRPAFSNAISDTITNLIYGIYKQVPYKHAFLDTGF